MPTRIDPLTLNAYLAADYRVLTPVPICLHIGVQAPVLVELLALADVTQAVLITAYNPYSQRLSDEENAARHQGLLAELARESWVWWPTVGCDPAGEWPDEPGCLVLGMNVEQGESLGRQWEQNAVLLCQSDGIPQLRLLR